LPLRGKSPLEEGIERQVVGIILLLSRAMISATFRSLSWRKGVTSLARRYDFRGRIARQKPERATYDGRVQFLTLNVKGEEPLENPVDVR